MSLCDTSRDQFFSLVLKLSGRSPEKRRGLLLTLESYVYPISLSSHESMFVGVPSVKHVMYVCMCIHTLYRRLFCLKTIVVHT